MKTPVVLAKANGRKLTSVAGADEGEISGSTGDVNPRGWSFWRLEPSASRW
jgi:hypothetical protein